MTREAQPGPVRGASSECRFPASLALPHDLIGPDRVDQQTDVTYPVILDILAQP